MGYQPNGGTKIGQGFKANSPNDTYWMFLNNEGFDGIKTVNALADMYAIPLARLREKTSLCFVASELIIYRLVAKPASGSTTADNWKALPSGEGSPLNPLGGITPDLIEGLLETTGTTGDFYLVEGAADAGTVVNNTVVGGPITVNNGDWILKGASGWRQLKMSSSVPSHQHKLSEVYVELDATSTQTVEEYFKTIFVQKTAVLAGNKVLDTTGLGSKLPTSQHVIDYVGTTVDNALQGKEAQALPKDFFIATHASGSELTYKTDTYRRIDLQPLVSTTLGYTNEVTRRGNDLFLTGGADFANKVSCTIIALYGCYIEANVLKVSSQANITIAVEDAHGLLFHRNSLYVSSRGNGTIPVTLARLNPYDLTDNRSITTEALPDTTGMSNDLVAYKDKLYVLINEGYNTNPRFISFDADLNSYEMIARLPVNASVTPPFVIYRDEMYTVSVPNSTNMVVHVYNLRGELIRESAYLSVPNNYKYIPLPHWMTIFNGKIIITTVYDKALHRVDAGTLLREEVIELQHTVTDDNSVFSDGYVYLNCEYNQYDVTVTPPPLIKVKYNNFADLTIEQQPYGGNDKGSYGSINYIPEPEALEDPLTASKQDLDGSHNIVQILNTVEPVISSKGEKGATGVAEVASLDISGICTAAGDVTVGLDGIAFPVTLATTDNTTDLVASKIRAAAYAGWTTGGTLSNVTFTNNATGAKVDATYSAGTTGATGTMTTTTQGVTDTRTTYDYFIVAEDRNGFKTLPSPKGTITDGNPTLDATNYNSVRWNWMGTAVKYYVLKGTTGQLLGSTTETYFEDKGQPTTAFTPPARNQTGDIVLTGEVYSGGATYRGDNILEAADVTVDGGANASPSLILRGKYDSDTALTVLSAKKDFSLINKISSGGVAEFNILNDSGTPILKVSDAGHFTAQLNGASFNWESISKFMVADADGVTNLYGLKIRTYKDISNRAIEILADNATGIAFSGTGWGFNERPIFVKGITGPYHQDWPIVLRTNGGTAETAIRFQYEGGGGSTLMSIYQGGNVGIGTGITAPTARLQVKGSGSDSTTSALKVTNTVDTLALEVKNDATVHAANLNSTILKEAGTRVVVQTDVRLTDERVPKDASVTLAKVNPADAVGISDVPATEKTKLETAANWDANGVYIGTAFTNTYQGQEHYHTDYFYKAIADNSWIRMIRG